MRFFILEECAELLNRCLRGMSDKLCGRRGIGGSAGFGMTTKGECVDGGSAKDKRAGGQSLEWIIEIITSGW